MSKQESAMSKKIKEPQITLPSSATEPIFHDNALTVLKKRYLIKDEKGNVLEGPADMLWRVAKTIAAGDLTYDPKAPVKDLALEFYEAMARLDFLPNSPTLMNAGRELGQLSACFVLPVEDTMESIFEAVKQTALIHKSGGGTGFSFSRIRPKNDTVHSTKGVSSGPLSFMSVFDCATETIKQGGTRRGANMAMLRVDHPDIMDFIKVKADLTVLNNFNLSVAITDEFMEAVKRNADYDLINPRTGRPHQKLNAAKVFRQIVKQAWTSGEPGVVFIDRMNADNPTPEVGAIESTNPCGEQPLLPHESCNLGSINLSHMVTDGKVNYNKLGQTVHTAVHFLDNVIDINRYPIPEIDRVTKSNRKIGLGVMGFADMLILMGVPYSSDKAAKIAEEVMHFIDKEALKASISLGKSRGAFPNFEKSIYGRENPDTPVRNATRTTIAPTGTLSILANCSSGVEPVFAMVYTRRVMDNTEMFEVNQVFKKIAKKNGFLNDDILGAIAKTGSVKKVQDIPQEFRDLLETAHDISPSEHIAIQAAFQKNVNNAVSKTINFGPEATREDVEESFILAFKSGCKGVTIYRDGCRDNQVLSTQQTDQKATAKTATPTLKKKDRPRSLTGQTYQMTTGCGQMYVTINQDENRQQFELFNFVGKAGGCSSSQCEAIGRLVSLAWRSGMAPEPIVKQLIGISCHKQAGFGSNRVLSCADAIAQAIRQHIAHNAAQTNDSLTCDSLQIGACPECGGAVEHEGGCCVCHSCGYSECA